MSLVSFLLTVSLTGVAVLAFAWSADRIVGMLVESPTGFGCPNQGRAELWREEADGDQFGSDDLHGSRRIGRVLISKNAFNVPEGSVVG